jgi:universal stress protein A
MSRIKRMLVPTDFSPTSDIALQYALDMAARDGATIHLLHVVENATVAAAFPDGLYAELPGLRERLIGDAQQRLNEAAQTSAAAGIAMTTQVQVGPPASAIAGEASARGTDLIVMGTHGRSGFAHLLLGSVAERVLRTAPCPVLTVRDSSRAADVIAAEAVSRRQAAEA